MAAQTQTSVIYRLQVSGPGLSSLNNPTSLDIIQIIGDGGAVLLKVTSTGTVTRNPATATGTTLLGTYFSRLTTGSTSAQVVADAFSQNNNNADILQVVGPGQIGIFHLDYLGVGYNS